MRTTHRAGVAGLLGFLLLAASGVPPGPLGSRAAAQAADPATAGRDRAVQTLLDQRAEAIRTRNRDAFLATVDPAADPDFRARQARLFDGLATVPLAGFELRLRADEIPDLANLGTAGGMAALDAGLPGAAEGVFLPAVEARYRIAGVDDADAIDSFFYTFVRRDGQWRIASDTDVEDLGLQSTRNLWDFGPVGRQTSRHFTILANPADTKRARLLLDLAEQAWTRLDESFGPGRTVPATVLLVLPHNLDQLREMIQATFDLSNFVAFATASIDRDAPDGFTSTAPRVYVQDANLARNQKEFQLQTLHHELVHVAAFAVAGPFVPNWIHEGVADWMSTGRPRSKKVEQSDGALPQDYEFTTGGGAAIVNSYRESTSAAAFLGRAKGVTAPLDLLAATGEARVAPGTEDFHVDQGLRRVFGAGFDDFQREWGGAR